MTARREPRARWLFVDAIPHFGGHEVMLLRWLEELQHEPTLEPRLLARAGSRLLERAPPGMPVAPFPPQIEQGRLRRWRNLWREGRALWRALEQEQPEFVICATGALGYQIPLVLLARWRGARVLVYAPMLGTFASMGYRIGWAKDLFVRWLYARVPAGWVAISHGQADDFERWARPRGPVLVLPNTVARGTETAPRLPLRTRAAGDRLQVAVLGRLDAPQKGLDLLLDHLEAAAPEVQDRLALRLTGEGPYGAVIDARRRANPALARCLTLAPWTATEQALAAADVLLLTSRFEGVPLVMLEAMALGLPVVASDLPGTRSFLPHECLFAVGDLAQAMQILDRLRDTALRRRLADAGRAAYDAKASSAEFARAVSALVHDLRERCAGTSPPAQAAQDAPAIAHAEPMRQDGH